MYKINPDIDQVTFKDALKTTQKAMSFWFSNLKARPKIYIIGMLGIIVTNIADIMIPKSIQWIIDSLVDNKSFYMNGFIFLCIAYFTQLIARYFWRITLARETHLSEAQLKSLLWNRTRYLPEQALNTKFSVGELMNIATGDIRTARFMFGFTMVGTSDFVFMLLFSLTAMFWIDWQLAAAALVVIPFVPFIIHKLSVLEHKYHKQAQEKLSDLTDAASQTVSTIKLQKISQSGQFWTNKLQSLAKIYQNARYKVLKTDVAFIPGTGIAPIVSYAVLIFFGAHRVFEGQLSVGSFVAMQSFIFIVQGPLIEMGWLVSEWQRGFASLERYLNLLNQDEEVNLRSGGEPVALQEKVFEASGLSFKYPGAENETIKNLSFELKKGSRLGIVGPVGSGKSTLIRILAGFEKDYQGNVKFCGKEVTQIEHNSFRKTLSYVPQKAFLFADTLRNNVRLDKVMEDDEIWQHLETAGLADDVRKFPKGLDTSLGEWGINLSGGQKQRLTIARALASSAPVILFDDCLSAVDTVTEDKILRALDKDLGSKSLIWVAHRKSTLKYCDQVLELKND